MSLKSFISLILVVFIGLTACPTQGLVWANEAIFMPIPGQKVLPSTPKTPLMLNGIKLDPKNPLKFDFILSFLSSPNALIGDPHQEQLKIDVNRLIKYFLANLAIPEHDLWVNLSPYEKDRMIPEALGKTELGRDLLAQDYVLKQLTASFLDPQTAIGKEFWNKVYAKAQQQYGTTNIPVDTYNKVWVLADQARIFQKNNAAYILDAHMKIMTDTDYLAEHKNIQRQPGDIVSLGAFKRQLTQCPQAGCQASNPMNAKATQGNPASRYQDSPNAWQTKILKELIIPAIEKEVNTGENFAPLRQMYHAFILASWYKKNLKQSILNQYYADKKKIKGTEYQYLPTRGHVPVVEGEMYVSPSTLPSDVPLNMQASQGKHLTPNEIYHQYLKAFKKGVVNLIQEEPAIPTRGHVPVAEGGRYVSPRTLPSDVPLNVQASQGSTLTNIIIPRKYFSGGTEFHSDNAQIVSEQNLTGYDKAIIAQSNLRVSARLDAAMSSQTSEVIIESGASAPRLLKPISKEQIPRYSNARAMAELDRHLKVELERHGKISRQTEEYLRDFPRRPLTQFVLAEISALLNGYAEKQQEHPEQVNSLTIARKRIPIQGNIWGETRIKIISNMIEWEIWRRANLNHADGDGLELSQIYPRISYADIPSIGTQPFDSNDMKKSLKEFRKRLNANLKAQRAYKRVLKEYLQWVYENRIYRSGLLQFQHDTKKEDVEVVPFFEFQWYPIIEDSSPSYVSDFVDQFRDAEVSFYCMRRAFFPTGLMLTADQKSAEEIVKDFWDLMTLQQYTRLTQKHINHVHFSLSAAHAQGIKEAGNIWQEFRHSLISRGMTDAAMVTDNAHRRNPMVWNEAVVALREVFKEQSFKKKGVFAFSSDQRVAWKMGSLKGLHGRLAKIVGFTQETEPRQYSMISYYLDNQGVVHINPGFANPEMYMEYKDFYGLWSIRIFMG